MLHTNKVRAAQIETWKARAISWSQLNGWQYNKLQWFQKYILNIKEDGNAGMKFGNTVGDTLGTPDSYVPLLNPHLVGIKEFELHAKMNGYSLIGYADHYCPETKVLNENKTSQNPNRWTQKDVNEHGQLDMYGLMLLLQHGTKPEDVQMYLNFIHVTEGNDFQLRVTDPTKFSRFQTTRTTQQCLQFGAGIDKIVKAMEKYAMSLP